MTFNKQGGDHKNGFINILFNQSKTIEQKQVKAKDQCHLNKFLEENVFVPRTKVRHIKIIKLNDTVGTNMTTLKADHIKRMFVDGSHVRQLTPNRQIATQDQTRKAVIRDYTPSSLQSRRIESTKKSISFYEEVQRYKQNSKQQKEEQISNSQVMILPMTQKSLEQTSASSFKNIRISLRHRRPDRKKEEVTKQLSLELKKQLFKFYSNPPCSPENISAKAYIVYQHKKFINDTRYTNKSLHAAFNTKINLQIASLTKIMTCILTLQICTQFKVDIFQTYVQISSFQTQIQGTSAELQVNESYTIEQLLYGLMLPSGNDASLAVSSFCGHLLEKNKRQKYSYEQINKKHYCHEQEMQLIRNEENHLHQQSWPPKHSQQILCL